MRTGRTQCVLNVLCYNSSQRRRPKVQPPWMCQQSFPRDWVGIFKVGWSSTKDYHTFVWVDSSAGHEGQQPIIQQVFFTAYYLPKDDAEFYQFCYVDSTGLVRGASTPFCFKTPEEQSTDNSLENDLVIITTQEKVDEREKEQEELVRELKQQKDLNETLKNTLKEQQQEIDKLSNEVSNQANRNVEKQQREAKYTQTSEPMADAHKELEENMKMDWEKTELALALWQLKEQNATLTSALKEQQEVKCQALLSQLQEANTQLQQERLEHTVKTSNPMTEKSSKLESLNTSSEKYDQALTKIKQLKIERDELKRTVEKQNLEIAQLSPKLRESEQESSRQRDQILLLQVDLTCSENKNEKLSAELHRMGSLTGKLDDLKTENMALHRSLSEQSQQRLPEKLDDDLKVKCQALLSQLQEANTQLQQELKTSSQSRRRAEQAERELVELKERLEHTIKTLNQMTEKSSKLEFKMTELHGIIQEKQNMAEIGAVEKEELSKENQVLNRNIERLRREVGDLKATQASIHYSNPQNSPTSPTTTDVPHQDTLANTLHYGNPYESTGIAKNPQQYELTLECRHCHEHFPGITPDELEQHELSHRVCPFCTLICDNMEQGCYEDHVYGHEV
ncbi:hypothetical protein DPEC_G00327780 [Dallia pectoralis]|uniref:Uncharacterized protein n=1 Tax=Dallia pectoralis TaxID=75939 RepID=A0ACC2F844_DALPE|nr:hypothetical protein DPEC_G00327780 [Dallia pectoralis]